MRLTRIYPNGDKVIFYSDEPLFKQQYRDADDWLEFNKKHRFGCYLFIDGVCVHPGNVIPEFIGATIGPMQDTERQIISKLIKAEAQRQQKEQYAESSNDVRATAAHE